MNSFLKIQNYIQENIDAELSKLLNSFTPNLSVELKDAMAYSMLGGGKRIRPTILCSVGALFNAKIEDCLKASLVLEMIHCYSLVHDDLPAMDNDILRRGKPTTHVKFGEANAILAGDGMLSLAFYALTKLELDCVLELIHELSKAATIMVDGQHMDIMSESKEDVSYEYISELHMKKTAALFEASVVMGAIIGKADNNKISKLRIFAKNLGLLFQVKDDYLDIYGNESEVGKKVNKDNKKKNIFSTQSKESALKKLEEIRNITLESANSFNSKILEDLVNYLQVRNF